MGLSISGLENIKKVVTERLNKMKPAFEEALEVEKERIQERTQSGYDVKGAQFRSYRPLTVKKRRAANKQVAHVDLTFEGDMFNAFKISFAQNSTAITGTMSFGKESWKVIKNQDVYGRQFFGLSKEQLEIIKSKIRQVS